MGNFENGIREEINQLQEGFAPMEAVVDEITGEMLLNMASGKFRHCLTLCCQRWDWHVWQVVQIRVSQPFFDSFRWLSQQVCPHFLGMPLNVVHHNAVYVSTEDDEIACAYLIGRQNQSIGLQPSSLKGLRFMFDSNNVISELDSRLTNRPADLVVVDCFSDLYMGSMNESNQVRMFLNQYSQLANRHQCLVIFLHHCGKRTEKFMPSKHNLLGSQAFEAKMRLVLELRNDLTDITFKHLCCVKGNYLSAEYKTESIKLQFSQFLTFRETGERVPLRIWFQYQQTTNPNTRLSCRCRRRA